MSQMKSYHLPDTDDEVEETTVTADLEERESWTVEPVSEENIAGMEEVPEEPGRPKRNHKPLVWHETIK